jgi:WD40 repeat protein
MSLASPYRGLAPFADSDADYFFGRERDTQIVVANLIASRLTVLYGPSGVGKSSLLLASVARSLRQLPEEPLVIVFSTWSDHAEREMASALAAAAGVAPGPLTEVARGAQALRDVYVILDQAEEAFTYEADAAALAAILVQLLSSDLRVNVLVSLREDTLARLDRLKGRVPAMFGNVLRLDRLDRTAGRAAIVRPLERWNELEGERMRAEEELVEEVLDGVGSDRIGVGANGNGGGADAVRGIEAPYLQLVMERLWEVERAAGSEELRLETLARLGGPRRIVADHLERAMRALDEPDRRIAADVFGHLVTPGGTKIAHATEDLAGYAAVPVAALLPVLAALAEHRILRRDEHDRYEIFHDVLAAEVLDWRRRYETERALERERATARRRQRRLGLVAGIALVGVALTAGLAIWALTERQNAQEQASAAQAAEETADQKAELARTAQQEAEEQAAVARKARARADREAAAARAAEREAQEARAEAEANAQDAQDAQQEAVQQAAVANNERDRADEQAEIAREASARATANATAAKKAQASAVAAAGRAVRAREKAENAATSARARERLAAARALLATNPESALQAALDALALDSTVPVEPVLRDALMRSRVTDVLPAGGGELVGAFPDAAATTGASLRLRHADAKAAAAAAVNAVVTVTRNGVIRVFDSRTGAARRSLDTGRAVATAAISPDRETIAVGGADGIVRVFSLANGQPVRAIDHVGAVLSVAYSGDGRFLVSTGTNETAKVWDAGTGALLHRLAHPRAVRSASFSAEGAYLLTLSSDRFVRVFDVQTGRLVARLDQGETPTAGMFAPSGRQVVTTGQDELPHVWETDTGKLLLTLEGHTGNVLAVAYTSDGSRIATAATDGTARIWDAVTGRLLVPLIGHTSFVDAVSFSPDGRLVLTASRDGTARVWNAGTGAPQSQLLGHRGRVTQAWFGADGRWALTASEDGTARTWSLGPEPVLRAIAVGPSPIVAVATSRLGTVVAEGRADGSVAARTENGRLIAAVRLGSAVTDVELSARGDRLLATGEDGSVTVWSLPKAARVARFQHGAPATSGALLPDGGALSAGRDGIVQAWDLSTGRSRIVAREAGAVVDLAVSLDGVLIATAAGDVARVRPVRGGNAIVMAGHRDALTSVAFSPDGRRLLTASFDHDALVWNVATGRRERSFVGHVAVVRGAVFSADGRWVATAGPTRVGLWETGPSSLVDSRLSYLGGHRGGVGAVAFSGVGWHVFSGGLDGTLRRYDCQLCGGTDRLSRLATRKLARLAADAGR